MKPDQMELQTMGADRVVITGMGWVTPLGFDVDTVWSRLLKGDIAIGPVTRYDHETFATNFAAQVPEFDLADFVDDAKRFSHVRINTKFALAAGAVACRQAGLNISAMRDPRRVGIYLGAGEGPIDSDPFFTTNLVGWDAEQRTMVGEKWFAHAMEALNKENELEQDPHMAIHHLARAFGARGPALNCMTACAASTQSVGEASEMIRRGDADVMLAGGAHSMIHPLGMTGFIRLTAMSTRRDDPQHASRPFDRSREGFVMGEGAGIVVLESLDHALARGATPIAELAGYGSSADAFRITDIQPDGLGAQAAMNDALGQAGVDPRTTDASGRPRVHYISAHGTGTQENDAIETKAVKGVFGELAPKVPFSSVKSMMGHLIQAAGVVEMMTCVQAIRTGWVPPTVNLNDPDPECDLDYVRNKARDLNAAGGVDVCLSNGFGFGGQNDCVCVRKFA
ncbi:MAG: beta-ketoacyl-[acyl-carrier-protein] synthase family protein [Phycisphaerales bacterium]